MKEGIDPVDLFTSLVVGAIHSMYFELVQIDIYIVLAILFGMVIQFFSSQKRDMRTAFSVIVLTIFMSIYIIKPLILYYNIYAEYQYLVTPIFALSSVISVHLFTTVVRLMKMVLDKKIKRIEDEDW